MKTFGILALSSSLFFSSTFAAPVNKRELVVITVTSNVIETIDLTTTIFVGPDATGAEDSVPTTTSADTTTTSTPASSSTSPSSSAAAAVPTSSSVPAYVAPTTSSTSSSIASTTSTPSSTSTPPPAYTPSTTSSSSAAPSSSAPVAGGSTGGSTGACSTDGQCSSSGTPCCGDITHYDTDAVHQTKGACGWVNDGATEDVVALPHGMMGPQSNGNPFCGRTVMVSMGGKAVPAKVVDKCMGCEGQSIDLSDHLFPQLGNPDIGRTQAKWWFTS